MMVLITYDVSTSTPQGQKRLRKVAKECVNYGQRVQKSVFECLIDPAQFAGLKSRLGKIIDPAEDSIRFYLLGKNWEKRVEQIGQQDIYNPEGVLLI